MEHQIEEQAARVAYPPRAYDMQSILLLSMATMTVYYGCILADRVRKASRSNPELKEAVTVIKERQALLFPVVASVTLMLLFFIFESFWVMLIMICFSAVFSVSFCSEYVMYRFLPRVWTLLGRRTIAVPFVGSQSLREVSLTFIGFSTVALYLMSGGYWMMNNVIGVCIAASTIGFMRLHSGRVVVLLFSGLFLYDMYWVFYSKRTFGENVMVSVATRLDLPIKLEVPRYFADGAVRMSMLGLGDIAIPGLCVSMSHQLGRPYFAPVFVGYVAGLIASFVALFQFGVAQPALIYLVPCTLIPLFSVAHMRNEVKEVWSGSLLHGDAEDDRVQEEKDGLLSGSAGDRKSPASDV